MKLQHVAVIFVIIIVPLTMVLATYINTEIKTIRYTSKYDAFLIDATYDALKAYQLNSFNNNIRTISNSKIRDIEASMNVYFQTLSSDFKSVGYSYDQMVSYTPAVLFSLYDGYYIYTKNFDVEKSINYNSWEDSNVNKRIANESTKYQYGLKPFVYYSCRYKNEHNDFVVNYTLDNRISVIGEVNDVPVTKSGPLLYTDETKDAEIIELLQQGEILSEYLLILDANSYVASEESEHSRPGEYEYVIYNNEKVYLDYNWIKDPPEDDEKAGKIREVIDNISSNKPKEEWGWPILNKLFFRYTTNYTKSYLSDTEDIANIAKKLKLGDDGYGHLYSTSGLQYYEEGKKFTEWVKTSGLSDITQYDAVDEKGHRLVSDSVGSDYYCEFVTDIYEHNGGKIFDIGEDNNPLLPDSAFNEHRISVIRRSIETNLSSAMNSYISEANEGYLFAMPVFTEDDWNKIENNICVTSFLQGMPVGSQIYDKYFVLSNNANQDAVDLDSVYVIARKPNGLGSYDIEYHKAGCKHLYEDIANVEIVGIYQSSDFKRRAISVSGVDINALSQLNNTEGTNFNYYYFHQVVQKNLLKGACYDCIVNVSTAYGAAELIQGRYYDYDTKTYPHVPSDAAYTDYLNRYKAALYRIRNNAYMINGYFGT